MFDLLFDFYYNLFVSGIHYDTDAFAFLINEETGSVGLGTWLSVTCSFVSEIIIIILCCLFVYKIIKLIGGLIR